VRWFFVLLAALVISGCESESALGSASAYPSRYSPTVSLFEPQLCAASASRPAPVSGEVFTRAAAPQASKPRVGVSINEAAYGLCLMRLTDGKAQPPSGYVRSDYSRRQAFNADGSSMLVVAENGTWHLYDPRVPAYTRQLSGFLGAVEPHWDIEYPNLISYLPDTGRSLTVNELNLQTEQGKTLGDLGERLRSVWPTVVRMSTGAEGSPSADGRYWAFQINDANLQGLAIVVWDKQTDTIISSLDVDEAPDHLSMSPSGRYVVVSWDDRTVAYSNQFLEPRLLLDSSEHSDLAIGSDGDDYYVSIDYASDGGDLFMVNLDTGVRTVLMSSYISRKATTVHVSGKAFDKPGWVVVSTYDRNEGDPEWFYQRIWLMEMKANPKAYPLAFHQSRMVPSSGEDNYWAEPQASINRAGNRVVFNSNWNNSDVRDVDVYSVVIPPIDTMVADQY